MSEFGYQSYPDMATIKAFAGNDPKITDPVLGAHQKHPRGNDLIKSYMEKEYPPAKDFESFVYLSQRLQAEGIGMGIEAQRLAMPFCMGSLYWQYNDCWPSVSWSSVDYFGRWKSLQYKVKRLFSPVLLVENIKNDTVEFQIVSDLTEDKKLHLYTDIYNLNGDFIFGGLFHLQVKAGTSAVYNTQDLTAYIAKHGKENLCVASRLLNDIGEVVSEDLKFLLHVKELNLSKSEITYEVKKVDDGYLIILNSKVVSPGCLDIN